MIEMIIGKKNRPLIDLGIITTVIILLMTALSETASAGLTTTSTPVTATVCVSRLNSCTARLYWASDWSPPR